MILFIFNGSICESRFRRIVIGMTMNGKILKFLLASLVGSVLHLIKV